MCASRGGRQPAGRASVLPLPSSHPFLTCLSSSSARPPPGICTAPLAPLPCAGMPGCCRPCYSPHRCQISGGRDASWDAGSGVAVGWGCRARCHPKCCPRWREVGWQRASRVRAGLLPPVSVTAAAGERKGKNMRFDRKRHGKTTKLTEKQTKQNQRGGRRGEGAKQQKPHVSREAGRARVRSLA